AAAEAAADDTAAAPRPVAAERRAPRRPNRARERRAATWTRPAWATDARLHTLGTISWALVPLAASLVAWGLAEANLAMAAGNGSKSEPERWERAVRAARDPSRVGGAKRPSGSDASGRG